MRFDAFVDRYGEVRAEKVRIEKLWIEEGEGIPKSRSGLGYHLTVRIKSGRRQRKRSRKIIRRVTIEKKTHIHRLVPPRLPWQ